MSGNQGRQPTKTLPCRECGEPVVVNIQKQKLPRCADCAVAVHERAIRDMAAKSGPFYQRWLASRGRYGRPKSTGGPLIGRFLNWPGQGSYSIPCSAMLGSAGGGCLVLPDAFRAERAGPGPP